MKVIGHDFEIKTYDIEGCFPNMPKEAIEAAARDFTTFYKQQGKTGVWIPRAKTKNPLGIRH